MLNLPNLFAMTTLRMAEWIPAFGRYRTVRPATVSPSGTKQLQRFTAEKIHDLGVKSVAEIESRDAGHCKGSGIQ